MKYENSKNKIERMAFAGAAGALSLATFLSLEISAQAFVVDPVRCQNDSVEQSNAQGRNDWFKKCFPREYRMAFSEGEFKMSGTSYDRRLYITFGVIGSGSGGQFTFPGNWRAPIDANAPCTGIPDNYDPIGVCTSGCYAPGQQLLFSDGWENIETAASTQKDGIITLSERSSHENLSYKIGQIKNYLFDLRDAQQELLEFKMLSGGSLVVTTDHPLLDKDGKMREARSFETGDFLIQQDGSKDPIVSIIGKSYYGKVYNVNLNTENDLENIVIAQGYLNGSLYFQSGSGVKKLNQILFRKWVVPASLIETE